jgi:N-methylhydantoinase A
MSADTGRSVRVGVDVGGTFTDVVTIRDGRVGVHKTPSTPDAPDEAVVTGLSGVRDRDGIDLSTVGFLGHGTTVATNAVLERDWADTALVTTEGFRDAVEIGRQDRPSLYDLRAEKPDPVVPRHRRYEVPGRIDERGRELAPLDEAAVRAVAADLRETGVESVAVALLFPFEDDAHERRVRAILREEGVDASVSLSSAVLPEIREYERSLATALNAALKPVLDSYVGRLAAEVRDAGVETDLRVMQSNGGLSTVEATRERPVRTLLSGPAAGVQGAAFVAGRRGIDDVLTMDMGGTSCDVSLVVDGDPLTSTGTEVGDYPVAVPSVDVHTVGAGGGSVAWLDAGGALRVGPRSAGADPGPVCYGRGGDRPTTTDAHLLLGRIDPDAFLPDGMGADRERVEQVVRETLAEPLGTTVDEAAQGVLDVANASMERALRVVSVERGHDPRAFTLVAYGGAGPLHAPALAEALDVPRVLVPRTAGVLSALGLLVSDVLYDHSASRVRPWSEVDPDDLAAVFRSFEREGRDRLADEGFDADRRRFERSLDLRYAGQSFELSVPVPGGGGDGNGRRADGGDGRRRDGGDGAPGSDPHPDGLDAADLDAVADAFHERHRARYGHADPDEPIELVTIRLRARGLVDPPDLSPADPGGEPADAVVATRPVGFDGERHDTPVYDRARLPLGGTFDGPAVVRGAESTTVVRPGQRVSVDDDATLVVEVAP